MKIRTFILSIVTLLVTASFAAAQEDTPVNKYLAENIFRASFNLHCYEFLPIHDTPAPKGYKPFYISHYGRHGSRSSSDEHYIHVRDVLQKAKEQDLLTPAGDTLLDVTLKMIEVYNGMEGRLTARGAREHRTIAQRMYKRFPAVFKKGNKKVRAISSMVPRCIISMNAFTCGLTAMQPDLDISFDTGEVFHKYIARGSGDKLKDKVTDYMKKNYKKTAPNTAYTLGKIFKDPEAAKEIIKHLKGFQWAIFGVARNIEAFDLDYNLFGYLTFEDICNFHEKSRISAYLRQCNSEVFGDERMKRSKRLVDTMVCRANEVLEGKDVRVADLIFGHDWPFLGLVSYIGLEGVGDRMSIEEAAVRWNGTAYTPFAANVQIIFYRKGGSNKDVLVKFLLNEKETAIPALTPVSGPYYRWSDVEKHLKRDFD